MSNNSLNEQSPNFDSAENSKEKLLIKQTTKETAKVSDNSLDKNNNNNIENIKENLNNNKNNKIKIKKHVSFPENFVEEIKVESWKKFNEDISTYAPYPWELEETKKEKICCNCVVF
jgi:hypothetical protein